MSGGAAGNRGEADDSQELNDVKERGGPMQAPTLPSGGSPAPATERPQTFWRGVLVGSVPIALLVVIAGMTLLLTALVRPLSASGGFYAQRQATLITLAVGGALAAAGYVAAIVWAWRHITRWSRVGAQAPVQGALIALAVTALLVLLPLTLAFVAPQQPAP
jgi:hypothetical protein